MALLQRGMTSFGSDDLQEIKAILPFKVVAVGRCCSEPECALRRRHESAHGCDFEKKGVLTLKVIEGGNSVPGMSPGVPAWLCSPSPPPSFWTMEIKVKR